MKNIIIKKIIVCVFILQLFSAHFLYANLYVIPGTNYYPNYDTYRPNYNSYYNPYYNPNYNYNPYAIPNDCYYYVLGYDRGIPAFSSGEPMVTRVPILSGNYPQYVNIANGLIYSAYRSISSWCNNNLFTDGVEDYFLNFASIESMTPNEIIMSINCAIQKGGVIHHDIEFKLTLTIPTNRFKWKKVNDIDDIRVYEYDSDTGEIIIIR